MSGLLDRFRAALADHGCRGFGRSFTCPAHEDRLPSLSIAEGDDGRVLAHCHAGCPTQAVVEALGMRMSDLFPEGSQAPRRPPVPRRPPWSPRVREGHLWTRTWKPIAPEQVRVRIGRPGGPDGLERGVGRRATFDDFFWSQSDEVIDAHFAALLAEEAEMLRVARTPIGVAA
jgi:hypothetical protein